MAKRKLDAVGDLDRSVEDFYAALGAEEPAAGPAAAPAVEEPAAAAAAAADLSAMTADLIAKDIIVLRGMPLPLQQALCNAVAPLGPSFFRADNEKTRRTDMLHLGKHFVGGRLCDLGGVPPLVRQVAVEAQARGTAGGLRLSSPLSAVDVAVVNAYRDGALGLGYGVSARARARARARESKGG